MRWILWFVFAWLFVFTGCVAMPKYPESAKNIVRITRDGAGLGIDIINGADTDAKIEYAKFNRETGELEIKNVEFVSSQSKNDSAREKWMERYVAMMEQSRAMNADNWAGVNQLSSNIISAVAPLLGQYMTGRMSLEEAKLMRPRLIDEAISLVRAGGDAQQLIGKLPIEIAAPLQARLRAAGLADVPASQSEATEANITEKAVP